MGKGNSLERNPNQPENSTLFNQIPSAKLIRK
jgi:hypothetical protein